MLQYRRGAEKNAWPLGKTYSSPLALEPAPCATACTQAPGPREMYITESNYVISTPDAHEQITTPEQQPQTWSSLPPALFPIPKICQGNPLPHHSPAFLEFHEHKWGLRRNSDTLPTVRGCSLWLWWSGLQTQPAMNSESLWDGPELPNKLSGLRLKFCIYFSSCVWRWEGWITAGFLSISQWVSQSSQRAETIPSIKFNSKILCSRKQGC